MFIRAIESARYDVSIVIIPKSMNGFPRERVAIWGVFVPWEPTTIIAKMI